MKKKFYGISALLLISIMASGAMAFPGFGFGNDEGVREAIQEKNYDSFMEKMQAAWENFKSSMTEEKFNEIADRQAENQENREDMQAVHEEIKTAIENGDYDTWVSLVEDTPRADLLDSINEDNFYVFVEMHVALEEQDIDSAKEFAEELGIEIPRPREGRGMGQGRPGEIPQEAN